MATPVPRRRWLGQSDEGREGVLVDRVAPRDRQLLAEQVADPGTAERHDALGHLASPEGDERGRMRGRLGPLHDELGVMLAGIGLDAQAGEIALAEPEEEPRADPDGDL